MFHLFLVFAVAATLVPGEIPSRPVAGTNINTPSVAIGEHTTREFLHLQAAFENAQNIVTRTLHSGANVEDVEIARLRSTISECVYATWLSRFITNTEESELMELSDAIFASVSQYLQTRDPRKYPPATPSEKQELAEMIHQLTLLKNSVLSVLFDVARNARSTFETTQVMVDHLLQIRGSLQGYYTDYDVDYRRAVSLENFVSETVLFAVKGADQFRAPSGICLVLADQIKRHLEVLRTRISEIREVAFPESGEMADIAAVMDEVDLLTFYEFSSGRIGMEIDALLRDIRSDFRRLSLTSDFLESWLLRRMQRRFERVSASVDHVMQNTYTERARDGIQPGQKSARFLKLDTPLACYLLSFTKWVTEFQAWKLEHTANSEKVQALIQSIKPRLTELKGLGKVLPKEDFWNDY